MLIKPIYPINDEKSFIVMIGIAKTGTSIVTKCLAESGYCLGNPKFLFGYKKGYETEHIVWRDINYDLSTIYGGGIPILDSSKIYKKS